jgi:LysR family hca operon transcriptional activator
VGTPPAVDLVLCYHEGNTSPLLNFLLSKVDDLKRLVSSSR